MFSPGVRIIGGGESFDQAQSDQPIMGLNP